MISIVTSKNGKLIRLTDERWSDEFKDTARMQSRRGGVKITREYWGAILDKGEWVLYVGGLVVRA